MRGWAPRIATGGGGGSINLRIVKVKDDRHTLPETNVASEIETSGKGDWKPPFSGAMLVSGRVIYSISGRVIYSILCACVFDMFVYQSECPKLYVQIFHGIMA